MIDARYVQTMARYNDWQNCQLIPALDALPEPALSADRGSFFGSLLGTVNHLLWGDMLWMSRFDPTVSAPNCGIPDSADLHATIEAWSAERKWLDGKIKTWADGLRDEDLQGDMAWHSGALGRDVTAPLQTTVMHFFNHQTHHRGQVHAMLTAAGGTAPVTDLFIMPEAF